MGQEACSGISLLKSSTEPWLKLGGTLEPVVFSVPTAGQDPAASQRHAGTLVCV